MKQVKLNYTYIRCLNTWNIYDALCFYCKCKLSNKSPECGCISCPCTWSCPWCWSASTLVRKNSGWDLNTPHCSTHKGKKLQATWKSAICRWSTFSLNIYDNSETQSYFPYLWGYRSKRETQLQSSAGVQTGFDFSLQAKSMSKRARAFFGGVQTRAMLLKSQLYLVMFFAAAVSPL